MTVKELRKIAQTMKLKNVKNLKKAELIKGIYEAQLESSKKSEPKKKVSSAKAKAETKPKATPAPVKVEEAKAKDPTPKTQVPTKVVFHRKNNRTINPMTFR
jgi:hypothetical protein